MTKKNIQIANAALFGAITIMSAAFTSCKDEKDDFNSTSVTGQAAPIGNLADSYTYTSDAGTLTLKLNGNDVFVSRNGSGNGTPNGKLVYITPSCGTLEMSDSTFSTRKIPFMKGTDIVRLDFNGTGEFSDNSIFLEKKMMTRAGSSEGDVIPGVLSEKDSQSLLLKTTRVIIDKFSKGILGDFGTELTKPLLDFIYPSEAATESKELETLKDIVSKMDKMQSHIELLEHMIRQNQLGDTYKTQWKRLKELRLNIDLAKEALSKDTGGDEQWKHDLNEFRKCKIDGSSLYVALKGWLEEYKYPTVGQKPLLQQIDEYIVTSYPFLSQSTGERLFYRTVCLQTMTEAAQLMLGYFNDINSDNGKTEYTKALEDFYEYFEAKSAFAPHENEVVCLINGAYLVMDKNVGVKTFGEKEWTSDSNDMASIGWEGQNLSSTEWAYSYVFSLEGAKTHKTELNTMCLTPDEAKAIEGYYKNKTLYQTLIQEAGMTGFNNNSITVLLLSTWAYPDWDMWSTTCHVMTRVWDFSKNQYNSNYEADEILSHKGIYNWYGHKKDSRAYFTNVTKRFTGITAYDDLIKYIVTPPDEAKKEAWDKLDQFINVFTKNKKTTASSK